MLTLYRIFITISMKLQLPISTRDTMIFAHIDIDRNVFHEHEIHFYLPWDKEPIIKPLDLYDDIYAPLFPIISGLLRKDFGLYITGDKSITLRYTYEQLRKVLGLSKREFDKVLSRALQTTDANEQDIDKEVKDKLIAEAIKAGIDKGNISSHADAIFHSGDIAIGYTVLPDIGKWEMDWERIEDMSSVTIRYKEIHYEVIVYTYYSASTDMQGMMHWDGDSGLFIKIFKPKRKSSRRL